MGWATTSDVQAMTGRTVTDELLAQADAVVTIYANRTPEASAGMARRDLYWLRSATAWQAAWQSQQPGYEQRSAAGAVTQDGMQVQYDSAWEVTLAPLARRSLLNVSWIGSKSLRVPSVYVPAGLGTAAFELESQDPYARWEEL